jgi:AcrR family transcriptional regulator
MTTRSTRATRRRAPLSRQRVLQTAIALADDHGIEALTMRKLGEVLGVEAMSLYNHVANKDDLLDGMVEAMFEEIGVPERGASWKAAMRQRALDLRTSLLRHPWAIGLMESRAQPAAATLRHHDAVLGILRKAGFSVEAAGHAYSILDSYIYGFALNDRSLPFDTSEEVVALGTRYLRELPLAEYPYLIEFLTERAMKPGYSYGDEFAFGLDLILDGLERVRKAVRGSGSARRRTPDEQARPAPHVRKAR